MRNVVKLLLYRCKYDLIVSFLMQSSAASVIGYLDLHTLDVLFSVDRRFNRVLQRNYFMIVMNWLKPIVPFLRFVKFIGNFL